MAKEYDVVVLGAGLGGYVATTCLRASSSPGREQIGVEFAYVLNSYGVDVTMIEFFDRIVPLEDEEVSAELNRQYLKSGIKDRRNRQLAGSAFALETRPSVPVRAGTCAVPTPCAVDRERPPRL
jgi:pyruvate/2-oxoglutarate dehydrogenase complex dihydrolipoamide dehydrogenase (E3) component